MKTNWMRIAALAVSSASLAGTASAELIAGWDFSQYAVDGSLDAGSGNVDTLPANYSSLDSSYGAGGTAPGDAADFGTLFMDGSLGSSDVDETAASPGPEVVAHANDTKANRLAPLDMSTTGAFPVNAFDAFNVLIGEGQAHQSRVGLTARSSVDLVFQADQGAVSNKTWELSFAGYALDPSGPVNVGVEVAPSCGAYSLVATVALTADEQAFAMPLVNVTDDDVCVRLSLDTSAGQPVIDNVAVPEPGFASMLVAGVVALLGLERRRRA